MSQFSWSSAIRERIERLKKLIGDAPARSFWPDSLRSRLATGALVATIVAVLSLDVFLATCGFAGCPTPQELRDYRPSEGGRILDRNGAQLGRMVALRRENVSISDVPQHVRDAFLVTEDRRFHEHSGIDLRGFLRALWVDVRSLSFKEGFSTITMQLARTSFISGGQTGNPLSRKLLELRLAKLIEGALTKDQILEAYLNAIYLGAGVYGIQGASRDIFGKTVDKLSIAEGALLAALPKAPSTYNPRSDVDRARVRRDLVLDLMLANGVIDSADAAKAQKTTIRVSGKQWSTSGAEPSALTPVRGIVDSVLGVLRRRGEDVLVLTTIDSAAQRAADNAVTRRATLIQRESDLWYGRRRDVVQGAMIAISPIDGDILALVGAGQSTPGGFNRALHARRQPGSAFKPFVYASAMAAGLTPATLVDDEPVSVASGTDIWTPANYGNEYLGKVTLRTALAKSANAATVRVSRAIGEPNIVRLAQASGITTELSAVPSIALGSIAVTPLELVAAYAPFANRGSRITPRLVRRIESVDGKVLWENPSAAPVHVLDERDAYLVTSMLSTAVDEGTGTAVRAAGIRGVVAGKTGTSNDASDLWFVGYTPTMVAGFWFGFDTPRQLSGGANGGRHAAPAWAEFYQNGWRARDIWSGWEPPAGMVSREIDEETGQLATGWCDHVRTEWFKAGSEPTAYCDGHIGSLGRWLDRAGASVSRVLRDILGTRASRGGGGAQGRDGRRADEVNRGARSGAGRAGAGGAGSGRGGRGRRGGAGGGGGEP